MKLIRMILIACAMLLAVACGDANQRYVRQAVFMMDKLGLFAEGPEWEAAKTEARQATPASLEEAQDVVRTALKVAGGKHSFIYKAEDVKEDAVKEWEKPSVRVEDGIAIFNLPPFSGNTDEGVKYAQAVLDAVPEDVRGVVIDLRGNTGGNMYPMIAAVHRFLPDDVVLRFRSRKKTQSLTTAYIARVAQVKTAGPIDCPVALLTDNHTASSGEATLICFRGLEKARVFGAPTAGYASANAPLPMSDGSKLVLTISCDVARTGEEFCDDPIEPDVLTETPLEDALAWLNSR